MPTHADEHRGEIGSACRPAGGGNPDIASPAIASPAIASPAIASPAIASPAIASPAIASPGIGLGAWHTLPPETVAARLGVDPARGLGAAEAAARLARHGANAIERRARRGWPQMLAAQFTDFMILVLIAAAIISGVDRRHRRTRSSILVIVVLNAVIGFVQE